MARDDEARLTVRLGAELAEWVEGAADDANLSKSELARRAFHFMREAQSGDLSREGEIKDEIGEIIEANRELRRGLLPSKWRSHIRDLFREDIRDDTSPNDLEILAEGYRRQAQKMNELADEHPLAPDADRVKIVDEELIHALEAADLSTWYARVDNPHERHLSGVEEGKEERRDVVAMVEKVVGAHEGFAEAYQRRGAEYRVEAEELPHMAGSLLPGNLTTDDVADLASELINAGVESDEVRDVLLGERPALDDDLNADLELVDDGADAGDDPVAVEASDETQHEQQQMIEALAAADGGRDPQTVPGHESTEASDTEPMNPTTESDDEQSIEATELNEDIEEIDERLEALDAANSTEVAADE